jgi:hypothetical protein
VITEVTLTFDPPTAAATFPQTFVDATTEIEDEPPPVAADD